MSSNLQIQKICIHCGKEFIARTTVTSYCTHKCNSAAFKARIRSEKIEASNKETLRIKTIPIELLKAKEFLTVKDVAILLNSSLRTVYRLIEQGNINAVNISERKTLVKRSDIDKLFEQEPSKSKPIDIPQIQKQDLNEWVKAGNYNITECYNLSEVQDKYGISEAALQNLIKRNNIPKIKKGWYAYVPRTEIDKLLSNIYKQ